MRILVLLLVWIALSVPIGVLVGRLLTGRRPAG
jgi:hypothetical protein